MIRYLIWRILFEAGNIVRLFGHGPNQVQYLAFGANLNDTVLKMEWLYFLSNQPLHPELETLS
jgi:hypothetical protein